MALVPGRRLGPYEVLSAIGAGGMGEVYRARDTRLDRIVAIKVLSADLVDRPDLRERFEREARTIANLNHPHICVLHDVGREGDTDYLVMEFVEGQTLAERLSCGPLPIDQVLRYAIEIADALDKAHRTGVTHRDLKPGNIMLTKSGSKLLDFGLAKLKQHPSTAGSMSVAPTATDPITAEGTILGTLQYMAPEQLEGRDADARADIFSFGAVVYEMATGQQAFEGRSRASIIANVLEHDPPPISSLQPMTPPALDRAVKRCLAKDPDDRWQSARDLGAELKWIGEGGADATALPATAPASRRRTMALAGGGLLAGAAAAAVAARMLMPSASPPPAQTARMIITLPPGDTFPTNQNQGGADISLSPAGDQIVYAAEHAGASQLFLRQMDSFETRTLAGTVGATNPFFSPDGQTVGFFADGKLKRIPAAGGPVTTITSGQGWTAPAWEGDTILFVDTPGGPLLQVSAEGGEPHVLRESAGGGVGAATFLPGGRAVAYSISPGPYGAGRIVVRSKDDTAERILVLNATAPRYIASGHLVYWRAGSLFAAPFDATALKITGPEVPVVEDVALGGFSVSRTGSLAYVTGASGTPRRLVWVDRSGPSTPLDAPERPYDSPQLSPDGGRVAIEIGSQTWIYDLARGSLTRLAFDGGTNDSPIWSADGKRIAVRSDRAGVNRVFWQLADGSGGAEQLTDGSIGQLPRSFSPDGRWLAYQEVDQKTRRNVWLLRLADRSKQPFLTTPATEGAAKFSPDGRWIAYVSDESGKPEVYVQPFPKSAGKWQVSTDGGTEPAWNRNGRELFFRSGDRMMAVDVTTQPSFSSGRPRMVFQGKYVRSEFPLTGTAYDVTADGQRFLMVEETGGTIPTQINVVVHWDEELKRRVPAAAPR